ncbi:MAG: lipoprotein-releasing ABC transporter permease subunit [Alphaproteobacteria bacterium]|nr:lipoprotein-releasing ABC transporter permease subunit [Alphaproteobacteria bacterium]MCL2505758.1 lipoprotein-releasing ABC transporter permease subunit [Alphaproteobacteria bacterium]
MFSAFERFVAFRYLRAKRQEGFISVITWFSLIGIALGVATLIVVMSVMNGFREELFSKVLGLNGHLNVYAMSGSITQYDDLRAKIAEVPDVISATPIIEAQALITKDGSASGAYVRGMSLEAIKERPSIAQRIQAGSLDDFSGSTIAIGSRMAQRLGLSVGDSLTLISPVSKSTVFGSAPRMKAYTIGAIFDVGMFEYDNSFIFMPLPAAQAFFSLGDDVTAIEIFVKDPQNLRTVRKDIIEAASHVTSDTLRLLDWQQSNSSFFTALQVEREVMFLILTLIILVAAFNIISSLIMLVKDKGRDIAILRTMGADKGMVMRIFFLNGSFIGITGTVIGLVLGLLVAHNIEALRQVLQFVTGTDPFAAEVYLLTRMPSVVDTFDVVRIVCLALFLSLGATLYPSWKAAKLDPVEALRYE